MQIPLFDSGLTVLLYFGLWHGPSPLSIEKPRATIIIMEKRINYQINQLSDGQSVEQFLRSKGYSKHLIIHLKQTDLGLTVDGKPVYTTWFRTEVLLYLSGL